MGRLGSYLELHCRSPKQGSTTMVNAVAQPPTVVVVVQPTVVAAVAEPTTAMVVSPTVVAAPTGMADPMAGMFATEVVLPTADVSATEVVQPTAVAWPKVVQHTMSTSRVDVGF